MNSAARARALCRRKITTIAERFHYEGLTGEVRGRRFPKNITLMALSYLLEGKHLVLGDPGWGKTTAAKVLAAVFSGVPYDLFDRVELRGNPQKYEEKSIARPDYGALAAGRERVLWLGALGAPVLVVDEVNRFAPEMQDVLLQGLDTGSWQYLNASYRRVVPAFLTANFRGEGTSSFIPPLLDRMSVVTEERYTGALVDYHAAKAERDEALSAPELVDQALATLEREGIEAFAAALEGLRLPGVAPIDEALRREARAAIDAMPLAIVDEQSGEGHNDALLFFASFVAEINHSERFGCKRAADPISSDVHDRAHAGAAVHSAFSPRSQMAALDYARGLAWLLGDGACGPEHLLFVLPHVVAHRFEFSEEFRGELAAEPRVDAEELHLARRLVERAHETWLAAAPGVKNLLAELQELAERGEREALFALDPDAWDLPLAKELIRDAQARSEDAFESETERVGAGEGDDDARL